MAKKQTDRLRIEKVRGQGQKEIFSANAIKHDANVNDFSKVVFGDDTTGKITTKGDITAAYDLTLIGITAGVEIANELNIGTKTLTIESNSDVTDTGTGHVIAKNLNLKTIAEYVENEEIFNIVRKLGADYSQGYFFSAPISAPDIVEYNENMDKK